MRAEALDLLLIKVIRCFLGSNLQSLCLIFNFHTWTKFTGISWIFLINSSLSKMGFGELAKLGEQNGSVVGVPVGIHQIELLTPVAEPKAV